MKMPKNSYHISFSLSERQNGVRWASILDLNRIAEIRRESKSLLQCHQFWLEAEKEMLV